ncbi:unnamed protein product [Lepeophtheirus salmonis]|uniref:(salmon louse) hypothetical protein n=1 Tax=Lepeophtheirus salmonis TaxID=72036 RepID=A0A7R8H1U1_LEPSM|nr:unnamed protein product [Lepeophtheirus salmonis]CAF2817725.1 unnamed protein product [Lepeophtheirus salmonis]
MLSKNPLHLELTNTLKHLSPPNTSFTIPNQSKEFLYTSQNSLFLVYVSFHFGLPQQRKHEDEVKTGVPETGKDQWADMAKALTSEMRNLGCKKRTTDIDPVQ